MWCSSRDSMEGRQRLRSDGDCGAYDGEEYHILVVGAPRVGKTAICQTYVAGKDMGHWDHADNTSKKEFCTWDEVDGQNCCIRLSKMPVSQEGRPGEDNSGNGSSYPGLEDSLAQTQIADGFLLIYSVTDKGSFDASPGLYHAIMEMRNHTDTPLVIAGHKSDATKCRHISISEGRDAAFDLGASFYETSVVSNPEGIKYLFHDVIRQVRAVRTHVRTQEQACTRVRGFINRLSLKSKKRRRSRSRSRLALVTSSQQTL